jgi:hypothetical protein
MGIWTNADGLTIKWGRDEGTSGTTGQYGDPFEGNHIIEARVDLTKYAPGTNIILDDYIHFPKGFRIERVAVYTEVAAVGGTSVDFGFIANDRATEIDYDGLVAALPIANYNAQGKRTLLEVGSTGAGALVGTVTTPSAVGAYPTVKTTGTFTAGVILLRVTFHRPLVAQS